MTANDYIHMTYTKICAAPQGEAGKPGVPGRDGVPGKEGIPGLPGKQVCGFVSMCPCLCPCSQLSVVCSVHCAVFISPFLVSSLCNLFLRALPDLQASTA